MRRPRPALCSLALVTSFILTLGGIPIAATGAPLAVTPSSSWGLDGRVNAIAVVGDTAYVGGNFDHAISPGGASATRRNLAAFSVSTGELVSSFRADAGSSVTSLATDGQHLFVGGHFGRLQGVPRIRVAKINLATGLVDTGFRADANAGVLALDVSGDAVYIGGTFTAVNGAPRTRVAKLSATSGAVDPGFQPTANGPVRAVEVNPVTPTVYAAGAFSSLNGISRAGVGALSTVTGQTQGPAFTGSVRPTLDLSVNQDGTRLFGALGAGNNSVTAWNTGSGSRLWRQTAMGDTQAVEYFEGRVYFGFHDGFAGDTSLKLLSADAQTGAVIDTFRPTFNEFWGVFAIAATQSGVLAGGDFSSVAGVSARNLVRFQGYPGADPGTTPVVLLDGSAATWRYWDLGEPPPGWNATGFDDAAWATGSAEFGYGDGDEATVVSYGPSGSDKYITTYLRVGFTVENIPDDLAVHLVADDGAVVYLNGVEVVRDNMPGGPVTDVTPAMSGRAGGAEAAVRSFSVDPAALVPGQNLLTVEVHQSGSHSSDLSLDADVTGSYLP